RGEATDQIERLFIGLADDADVRVLIGERVDEPRHGAGLTGARRRLGEARALVAGLRSLDQIVDDGVGGGTSLGTRQCCQAAHTVAPSSTVAWVTSTSVSSAGPSSSSAVSAPRLLAGPA